MLPVRRSEIIEYEIDGEAVLFDPRAGELHLLNAAALNVWRHLDMHVTISELAVTQAVNDDTALAHVRHLIALLDSKNLLRTRNEP